MAVDPDRVFAEAAVAVEFAVAPTTATNYPGRVGSGMEETLRTVFCRSLSSSGSVKAASVSGIVMNWLR